MKLKEIIRQKIYNAPLSEIQTEKKCIINAFNPHSYIIAKKDNIFKEALLSSDVLLPDGVGVVFAAKILNIKGIRKIAGADIHQYLLTQANEKGQAVFYAGATESTLKLIEKKIQKEYPNIRVGSYSPPFRQEFSQDETTAMITAINEFIPDILFVGMTAPKQEKWVYANKDRIETTMICSIGAVFDFYAGTVRRSGSIWIKLGLEWLPRLLREPKRLLRRNIVSSPLFLWEVFKEKFI